MTARMTAIFLFDATTTTTKGNDMRTKPINPYARLMWKFRKWMATCRNRRRTLMWTYSMSDLVAQKAWRLDGLFQRVEAAQQLGYEIHLTADNIGLHVKYVEGLPESPV